MSTGAASDGFLRGCLSASDAGIQRRPYHRNCGCELHKSRGHCSHTSPSSSVSYPLRRAWSDGCLALMAASSSSSSSSSGHASPGSPTSVAANDACLTQISRFALPANEEE